MYHENTNSKKCGVGTFLEVQCLRLWASVQTVWVPALVRELQSHMPQSSAKNK